jgi:hypothetical protein
LGVVPVFATNHCFPAKLLTWSGMTKMGRIEVSLAAQFVLTLIFSARAGSQSNPTVIRIVDQYSVVLTVNGHSAKLHAGEHLDNWNLMQVVNTTAHPPVRYAVLEDFAQLDGGLVLQTRAA